jgi:predicted peptidase
MPIGYEIWIVYSENDDSVIPFEDKMISLHRMSNNEC